MDGNKLNKLINQLVVATASEKIGWRTIKNAPLTYSTHVSSYYIELSRAGNTLLTSLGYGTKITVKSENGVEIISGVEGEIQTSPLDAFTGRSMVTTRLGPQLSQLFELVRSTSSGANIALDEIISALEK